ncbi:MAG: type IV pilus modification protein PilV [Pseudomonadota bacterium]
MNAHHMADEAGFSLLECMLALLIVTLGIVGLMSLQGNSIIAVHEAKMRSDAGLLANEMIGLLWVDRLNLANYALNPASASCTTNGTSGSSGSSGTGGSGAGGGPTGPGSNSTSNAVVASWESRIAEALPGASAYAQSITIGNGNVVTIMLCWRGPQDTAPRTYTTVSQIQG